MKKLFCFYGFFVFFASSLFAQVTLTIPNVAAPAVGQKITVPIVVSNFNNVGAVTLKIQYNQSVAHFDSASRSPEFFSGANGSGTVTIARADINPVTPVNGTLMNLYFTYLGGTADFTFNAAQSEITTTTGGAITGIVYQSGHLSVPCGTAEIGKVAAPSQSGKVTVPINVTDFTNVGAITFKIQYNTSAIRFDSSSRSPEFFSGANGGVITIARADINAVTPVSGKLLDLFFTYLTGTTDITFNTAQCEVTTTTGVIINCITYLSGNVTPPVQGPPVFTAALHDTTINEGQTLTFDYNATDPNSDVLAFSLPAGNPTGASINPTSGVFTWTPNFTQAGTHSIFVGVTDGTTLVVDTAVVTVANVNRPPVFTKVLPDTTIKEGQTLTYTFTANDSDGTALNFSLVSPPSGAAITPAGIFSWTPGLTQAGTYSIITSVTDGTVTIADTASVTVTESNRPPYFINTMPDQLNKAVHDTITFHYTAGDSDGVGDIRFGLFSPPAGATIDSISGQFRFITPSLGTFKIIVTLTDHIVTVNDTAVVDVVTGIKTELGLPVAYELSQNYPNPFNPSTTIRFSIPTESFVTLKVYNVVGQLVATLVNEVLPAAYHEYSFNASNLTSGIYVYKLQAGDFISTKKMTLIK